jgi:hypothetical protein
MATRRKLLKRVKQLLPRDVKADGKAVKGLKFGAGKVTVDAELLQYNSCALWRLCRHLHTGTIPHHLARNSALKAGASLKARASRKAPVKRPAAQHPASSTKRRKLGQ